MFCHLLVLILLSVILPTFPLGKYLHYSMRSPSNDSCLAAMLFTLCRYEAHCALDGGEDGLTAIRQVLSASYQLLVPLG